MRKAPDAFRTISEASDALQTPAHVLRFWESKFSQIKPVKRAGGRRYYRPADIELLSGIKALLHDQGMTIRGVQKLLVEKGVRHVAQIAAPGDISGDVFETQADLVVYESDDRITPATSDKTPPATPLPDLTAKAENQSAPQTPALGSPLDKRAPVADAEAGAEAEAEKAAAELAQADANALPPVLPFLMPNAPLPVDNPESGPKNAFANFDTPTRHVPIRATALADTLRKSPPPPERLTRTKPLVIRLEALIARMQKAQ